MSTDTAVREGIYVSAAELEFALEKIGYRAGLGAYAASLVAYATFWRYQRGDDSGLATVLTVLRQLGHASPPTPASAKACSEFAEHWARAIDRASVEEQVAVSELNRAGHAFEATCAARAIALASPQASPIDVPHAGAWLSAADYAWLNEWLIDCFVA